MGFNPTISPLKPRSDADSMSNDDNFDIETLRCRMRPLSVRIRESLKDWINGVLHRDWVEVDAEVCDCTPIHRSVFSTLRRSTIAQFGGYAVCFIYVVQSRKYQGITNSPVELQEHDKFAIRYNPKHPEENNTFDSETSWTVTYTIYFTIILFLFLVFLYIGKHFYGK